MTKEKEKLKETFCKLFALLGSDNENEADTARKKIRELATKNKMSWNDVIELVGFNSTKDAASADADGEAESAFDAFMNQMPPNQFAALIGISHEASLFRSPDGVTWADISVKDHRETWPVYSAGFKGWLRFRYFRLYGTSPSPEAIERCLDHVEAKALFGEGVSTRDVYLRVAGLDDKIYLDLCNDDWTAVEVDASGWRIVKEPPVRFSRNSGMKELPTPISGGTLSDLHSLLSVDDDGLARPHDSNINVLGADDVADDGADDGAADDGRAVSSAASSAASSAPNLLSGNGFGHADDADDVPATSRGDKPVCQRCGLPSSIHFGQLIRANGAHYHPRCWTEERTKGPWKPKPRARRPALGPEGDSLDDL
jgi:hypothetical protein